jgi:hypothetical protein
LRFNNRETRKQNLSRRKLCKYLIVAEKIDEFSSAENLPNCAGGIREFYHVTLIVSRLLVSL